jgi:macrolide-specific efflux system membrane fusion protein
MSASVTVLVEQREEAVLVPNSAVRQLDGEYFVTVPGAEEGEFERVTVTLGESDGTRVEILSGLEAGDTVLIGAATEGTPYTATTSGGTGQADFPGGFTIIEGAAPVGGGRP